MVTHRAFLALFVAVGVGAVPYQYQYTRDLDTCASQCSGRNTKFQYKPGTEYRYRYEVNTETTKPLMTDESTKVHIEAIAEIQAGEDCEYVLRLRDVNIFQSVPYKQTLAAPEKDQEFKHALEKNALRFSFDDGVIRDVCPDESEEPWPLNFKKGLLSSFQNSLRDFKTDSQIVDEVDVSGECPTEYTVSQSWGWSEQTITKSKQMSGCTKRTGAKSIALLIPYHVESVNQDIPGLKSSQKCEFKVSSQNILTSAECSENHRLMPFSNEESGARTTVSQKLTFQNQALRGVSRPPSMSRRDTLLFSHGTKPRDSTRQGAEQILKELCVQTRYDIRPETPRVFTELSDIVGGLPIGDLETLYRQLKRNTICPRNDKAMRFFLNSLPNSLTLGPIRLMMQLIESGNVDERMTYQWIKSLSMVRDASEETVQAVKHLLNGKYKEEAMLPVSAVITSFCRKNQACQSSYIVQDVQTKLAEAIGYRCYVDNSNIKLVLMSLRALGNIKGLSDKTPMNRCLISSGAPLEVKVAAADAYRLSACPEYMEKDDALWSALKDKSADIEIRVASYLSIMRCPDPSTLEDIARYLNEIDEDDHIGVFISSHLNNLMQSSDPLKQELAKTISNLELKNFEPKSATQSRNMEASAMIKKLNIGGTVDSHLVMSPNAPVPRAARVNVSLNAFGQAINLIEIGGRAEGLETILQDVLNIYEPVKSDRKKREDVRSSAYVRIFGNEVFYKHRLGTEDLIDTSKIPSKQKILEELAKKQKVAYSVSRNLIDETLTIPTAAGLPLEIRMNSSATIDLKVGGKADLTGKRRLLIDGGIQFGAALEFTGSMSVNALVTQLGLRMRNVIHSSTEIKGSIDVIKGRLLSLDIEAPRDGMEIFQGKSEFFLNYNGVEKKQDYTKDLKTLKLCTSEKAAKITGAELCGELGHSHFAIKLNKKDTQNSYKLFAKVIPSQDTLELQYQLNTPGSSINRLISMDLTFRDKKKEGIALDVQIVSPWKKIDYNSVFVFKKEMWSITSNTLINDKDRYATIVEIKISEDKENNQLVFTPFVEVTKLDQITKVVSGQVTIRKGLRMDLDLEVQKPDDSPRRIEGQVILSKDEKRIKWVVTQRGNQVYMVNIGGARQLTKERGSQVWDYKPEIIVQTPEKVYITLTSHAHFGFSKQEQTVNGNVNLQVLSKKPTSVEWNLDFKKDKGKKGKFHQDISLKVKSPLINGNLVSKGYAVKSGVVSNRVKVYYNIPGVDQNSVVITGKLTDKSKNALIKYSYKGSLDNKAYPDYNHNIVANMDHKKKHSSVAVQINYGKNPNLKRKQIDFTSKLQRTIKDQDDINIVLDGALTVPEQNVDFNIGGSLRRTPKAIESEVSTKLWPFVEHPVKVDLQLHDRSTKLRHLDGQASLQAGDKKYALSTIVNEKSKNHQIYTTKAVLPNGERYMVITDLKTPSKQKREFTSDIEIHGMKRIQISGKSQLVPSTAQLGVNVLYGKKNYGLNVVHKHEKDQYRKLRFEAENPSRKVELQANVKQGNDKRSGDFLVNWDAHKKNKAENEIKFESMLKQKVKKDSRTSTAEMSLRTPFEKLKDVGTTIKYVNDPEQYNLHTKVTWDGKKKIAPNVVIKKPLNPYNIKINLNAHTSFKQYKHMSLDIDHTLDQAALATVLKGNVGDDSTEVRIKGENRGQQDKTSLHGIIDLKTPLSSLKHIHVTADLKNDGSVYETRTDVNHDGDRYSADITANIDRSDPLSRHNGRMELKYPQDRLVATWNHELSNGRNIDSTLNAKWGKNKNVDVALRGQKEDHDGSKRLKYELKIKSPFENNENINVILDHSLAPNKIDCKCQVLRNNKEQRGYNIFLERNDEEKNARLYINPSPDMEPIKGEISLLHGGYPKTYSAWLQWNPSSRIDMDGSLNAKSLDDMEFAGKLTTPFDRVSNINVRGSHKLNDKEYISHANVVYGVGKMVDLEHRYRNDDQMKKLRLKLETPCESLSNVDTGMQVDLRDDGFTGQAEIEALPHLKKHDGRVTFTSIGHDRSANLELNTPEAQPLLKVITSSKKNRDSSRTHHIEVVPADKGVYSLKSTHQVEKTPYILDIGASAPQPDLKDVGVKITCDPAKLDWQAVIAYKTDKHVDVKVNADWSKDPEVTITVKTPFKGYKRNYVNVRWTDESSRFTRHSEAKIGKTNIVTEVSVSRFDKSASVALSASLKSPFTEDMSLSLNHEYNVDARGVKHLVSTLDTKRGQTTTSGRLEATAAGKKDADIEFTLTVKDRETLADVLLELRKLEGESHGKLVTKGSLIHSVSATVDHKGVPEDFTSNIQIVCDNGIIDQAITFKTEKSKVDLDAILNYKYEGEDHTHKLTLKKSGGPKNLKIDVTRVIDGQEITGKIIFKAKNKISGFAEIKNLQGTNEVRHIQFEHDGDREKFITSGQIQLNQDTIIAGKVDFYRYGGWKHVEMNAELTTPVEGYSENKLEYRHDVETAARTSINVNANSDGKPLNLGIIRQYGPRQSINMNIKTPLEGYQELVLALDIDKSSVNGKLIPRDDLEFVIRGTHSLSDYPVTMRYTITTPLESAKSIAISLTSQPYDRTLDITVERSDGKKTTVHTDMKIQDKSNAHIILRLNGDLDDHERVHEPFSFVLRRDATDSVRTGHLEIGKYLISDISLQQTRNEWKKQITNIGTLEWSAPALKDYLPIQKWHGTIELTKGEGLTKNKIVVSTDDKVRLNVVLSAEKDGQESKVSAVFRAPRPMEYSLSVKDQGLGGDSYEKDGDLVLNWNTDDIDSNVHVHTSFRDESTLYVKKRSLKLSFTCPTRSIDMEHSFLNHMEKLEVSGKIYVNKDKDKGISYLVDFNTKKRGRAQTQDALIKLGLPSRTLGFTGSVSDDKVTRRSDAAFSWDMDRDEDKKIGIKSSLSRGTYQKADITLTLPAELQVNSEMTLNQGNTLFDGKTDISYSRDSGKTLTVFSKIRDIKSYSSGFFSEETPGFNYSVEFGLSHPETRTDMTVDSHIGVTEGLLTSSVGLSYMTSRRQVINMALSTEINRIKKQISLNAEYPEHSVAFISRMVSETPLQVAMRTSMDGEDAFVTNINIDKENKRVRLEIGEPDNLLIYEDYYPNSTAWQATLSRKNGFQDDVQEGQIVLRLTSPKVLHTALDWRPEAVEEAREWLVNRVKSCRRRTKNNLKEISTSVTNELIQKHEDVVKSISEDTQPLMQLVEDELENIGKEVGSVKKALKEMKDNNDLFLGDITDAAQSARERYSSVLDRLDSLQQKAAENRRWLMNLVSEHVEDIKNSEFRQNVRGLVSQAVDRRIEMVDRISAKLLELLEKIDEKLRQWSPSTILKDKLNNNERLEALRAKLNKVLNSDFDSFFDQKRDQIKEAVQAKLQMLKERFGPIKEYLSEPVRQRLEQVTDHIQNVADYWVDQDVVAENVRTLLKLLREEVKEKLSKYSYSLQMVSQNPFTVYDPENGKIRANIDLPVALKRLDELPEIQPYLDQMKSMARKNKDKVANVFYYAWQNNETDPNHQVITI